jgi:hypothetical protein
MLLTMVGLELEEWLNHGQFQILWTFFEKLHVENLCTENLAHKHLRLLDPFSAFVVIRDIDAIIYLYYADCKEQLHHHCRLGR